MKYINTFFKYIIKANYWIAFMVPLKSKKKHVCVNKPFNVFIINYY